MEVDDAIVMAEPVEEQTVLAAVAGGEGEDDIDESKLTTPSGSTSSKQKRAKIKHDKEEPPGSLDMQNNDSVLTATPFKLEVSGSEDEREEERDGASKAAIRRKLLSTPMEEDTAAKDGLEELEEVAIKRKRYEVRRSGSEECLLGFDELSGEAELVKAEEATEEPMAVVEEEPVESVEEPFKNVEEVANEATESPLNSPKSSKKASPLTKIASPALHTTRSASKSPKALKPKTPPLEVAKPAQKSPKPHIVGDGEETNGVATTPLKTSSQTPGKKPLSPQDEFYKKPFEFGWKRELVWRANPEQSKDKADVYFISPAGKKLRGRSEIIPLLEGDLTIEHFCFTREPLGAGPEVETVRSAKPSSRASVTAATLAAAPTPPNIGKRVSKPKGPKGASPPPQGWTPSKALKVNNAALLSSTGSAGRVSAAHHTVPSTPPSSRKHDNAVHATAAHSAKNTKAKKSAVAAKTEVIPADVKKTPPAADTKEPCTVACAKAQGQIPQLQCTKCLCLHHHECVGLNQHNSEYRTTSNSRGKEYICEACLPKSVEKSSPVSSMSVAAAKAPAHAVSNKRPAENKFPQTIAVVKGKKYVMVAKPLALPNEHVNDIENDLKQINESIRKNRKQSNNSLDGSSQAHNSHNSIAVEQSNKLFATNFFANVSYAYDSLLCILKYLKIHERPRAAAVCKLWNLAAKDTSLWQTVRMKNSKVCSWTGFAGALRRGETKQLDLRKMLLPSGRSEDMWNDFCSNIGTVCSLETIDLCRCSARVVESLFQSNRNLKVINALAINDDTINLEHIALLQSLEELRLRTCEAGVLSGDLAPMASLSQLTHLSLTSIKGLGAKSVEVLGELTTLKSLELGECGDFDSTFAEAVLPKLINLQRLRLENSQVTNVCTLEILDAVARLVQLNQLELVNFDIKPGFDEKLSLCMNINKLLIIPTYISQSATTNQIVLSAVQQVSETLKVFTWCVTVELLRVTALYVDQCEESTKKEKHHFDECIPVLKPVPGATTGEEEDEEATAKPKSPAVTEDGSAATEVPQIEILPLDKVETILAENLPNTKFTIVKVPYHATCKQQLVELN
ncbi:uncharacterized protein LOC135956224 isoform X2 [Calliphora vicina]|uniref:uncharacterized protein LOC135956224 isoform X2 n=1 Tax=Calliphora vicina TaxID=7373 RepID=UPI00325ADB40